MDLKTLKELSNKVEADLARKKREEEEEEKKEMFTDSEDSDLPLDAPMEDDGILDELFGNSSGSDGDDLTAAPIPPGAVQNNPSGPAVEQPVQQAPPQPKKPDKSEIFFRELKEKTDEINEIIEMYLPEETGYQRTVLSAMNYSVKAGGKRIRPLLMKETYTLFGGKSKVIEPFMAAIEMIHTYSLVHDDLPAMDNDMLRRGKPTTHAKYGEAMAILTGDALLNLAFEIILRAFSKDRIDPEPIGTDKVIFALSILAEKAGIYGMIGGQVIDVEGEKSGIVSKKRMDTVYRLKTGALIEASMMIGAILGGAVDSDVSEIERIAGKIGLAFQIQDDILDVIGDSQVIGKETGQDARNNKMTYVSYEGMEKSAEDIKKLTDEAISGLNGFLYQNEFLNELVEYLVYRDK